jgi:hypothetical protein
LSTPAWTWGTAVLTAGMRKPSGASASCAPVALACAVLPCAVRGVPAGAALLGVGCLAPSPGVAARDVPGRGVLSPTCEAALGVACCSTHKSRQQCPRQLRRPGDGVSCLLDERSHPHTTFICCCNSAYVKVCLLVMLHSPRKQVSRLRRSQLHTLLGASLCRDLDPSSVSESAVVLLARHAASSSAVGGGGDGSGSSACSTAKPPDSMMCWLMLLLCEQRSASRSAAARCTVTASTEPCRKNNAQS